MIIEEAIVYLPASPGHGMKFEQMAQEVNARGLFLDFQKNLYLNNIAL